MGLPQAAETGRRKMTFEQFLDALDEDIRAERIDGEVVTLSPASALRESVGGFLYLLLRAYVEQKGLGRVLIAPSVMRLPKSNRGREPDILFVKRENLARLKDTYPDGAADLVVEITSAESRLRDRGEKYTEYELEGVPEYWTIAPEEKRVDFFVLSARGLYERHREDAQGVYLSQAISGLALPVHWLWECPPLVEAIRKLGRV